MTYQKPPFYVPTRVNKRIQDTLVVDIVGDKAPSKEGSWERQKRRQRSNSFQLANIRLSLSVLGKRAQKPRWRLEASPEAATLRVEHHKTQPRMLRLPRGVGKDNNRWTHIGIDWRLERRQALDNKTERLEAVTQRITYAGGRQNALLAIAKSCQRSYANAPEDRAETEAQLSKER